jgi:hypothetical protein
MTSTFSPVFFCGTANGFGTKSASFTDFCLALKFGFEYSETQITPEYGLVKF